MCYVSLFPDLKSKFSCIAYLLNWPYNNRLSSSQIISILFSEPHSSVGSVADLRTVCPWFDLQLGQNSLRRLMIVIMTGFIPLSPLSVVLTMVICGLERILCRVLVKRTPGKHG